MYILYTETSTGQVQYVLCDTAATLPSMQNPNWHIDTWSGPLFTCSSSLLQHTCLHTKTGRFVGLWVEGLMFDSINQFGKSERVKWMTSVVHDQQPSRCPSATNQPSKCSRGAAQWSQFCGLQLPGVNVCLYMNVKHMRGGNRVCMLNKIHLWMNEWIIHGFIRV